MIESSTEEPTESPAVQPWWTHLWPVVAIVVGGCFVFWPALRGGWIWDDYPYLAQNPVLRTLAGLQATWLAPAGLNYFPVTATVQWLQWHVWGEATTGYHLTNVGLHLLNCVLLWRLLVRLDVSLAWLGGLLFAVHPLTVESVAWISELKNVLSLAFLLGSLIAYLDFDDEPRATPYLRAWLLFVAAMLSKSTVALFPAVLLLLCWSKRGQLRLRDLGATGPFFAVAAGLGLVTVWFEHHRAILNATVSDGLLTRAAGAGRALVFYLQKSVWPTGLLPSYPHWSTDRPWLWAVGPWLALAFALGGIAALARNRARDITLGAGWFLLGLLPTLGFIPMAYLRIANVADHFAYLALPGILGLVAAGCGEFVTLRGQAPSRWLGVVALAGCLTLAAEARRDARAFSSEQLLWQTVLDRNPGSWLAHNHLGAVWLRAGQRDAARTEFETALRYAPDYVEAHNNLGVVLENSGQLAAAATEFQRALELRPNYSEAHANLAAVHGRLGVSWLAQNQPEKAALALTEALRLDPDNPTTHNNLGLALAKLGRPTEATAHYETALQLKPDYPEAHTNLGNILLRSGHPANAAAHYEEALRIAPAYAPARENLAYALRLARAADTPPTTRPPSAPR